VRSYAEGGEPAGSGFAFRAAYDECTFARSPIAIGNHSPLRDPYFAVVSQFAGVPPDGSEAPDAGAVS